MRAPAYRPGLCSRGSGPVSPWRRRLTLGAAGRWASPRVPWVRRLVSTPPTHSRSSLWCEPPHSPGSHCAPGGHPPLGVLPSTRVAVRDEGQRVRFCPGSRGAGRRARRTELSHLVQDTNPGLAAQDSHRPRPSRSHTLFRKEKVECQPNAAKRRVKQTESAVFWGEDRVILVDFQFRLLIGYIRFQKGPRQSPWTPPEQNGDRGFPGDLGPDRAAPDWWSASTGAHPPPPAPGAPACAAMTPGRPGVRPAA